MLNMNKPHDKRLESKYRTHHCGELRAADVGSKATLSGWLMRKRDHGGIVFVDLRDNYGVTQIIFPGELKDRVQSLRVESVICVEGEVVNRSPELINKKLSTGEIEVRCEKFEILGQAEVLPFQIAEEDNAPEATRLKYRFLELRRERLHKNIQLRSKVFHFIRNVMHDMGFTEFQTPVLTSSSPEGARDFIVPSRLHPGKFYALPQAPQQFKQLIMIAGFDRYFQIAPCFRDEDSRADRSPGEFYQLDMELSFVEEDDVYAVNEEILRRTFEEFADCEFSLPKISYYDALEQYGTDKPDLRNPLKIQDVSTIFKDTEFKVFQNALEAKGKIRAIKISLDTIPSRKFFDDVIEDFKIRHGEGLAYLAFEKESHKGSIAKFVSDTEIAALRSELKIEGTSVVFLAAGRNKKILPALGRLRNELGERFDLLEKDVFRFCWISEYPLYEEDDEGKIQFSHNPFSMPAGGLEALNSKHPLEVGAYQYDIVCNGYELGSGAIRNHDPETMYRAFEIAGYDRQVVDQKFGGMKRAFEFGAPPHGGFAHGLDRIVMLLTGEKAIREVIVFPLAQTGEDLMMGAPSELSNQALDDVHIQIKLPPGKG